MFLRAFSLLALIAMMVGCSTDHPLDANEVRALFSNKTVRGHHHATSKDFYSFYDASGVYRSRRDGESIRPGRWWVEPSGIFCVRWDDEGRDYCRRVLRADDGTYRKVKVKSDGGYVTKVTFAGFEPGNPRAL